MNPFPIESGREYELLTIKNSFDELMSKGELSCAGRVMAIRGQGAILFVVLFDGTTSFQVVFKKDEIEERLFGLFVNAVDIGDIVNVKGALFVTQRGEKSVLVKSWHMLAKSLRPLPEKWSGLTDVEERFRKRYLDTLMSEDIRNRFVVRSRIVSFIRSFLDQHNYLEVETPQLQPLAGGTNAEPFKTHHNALDIDLYLRIAPELYLKKLLIGGFPKVYEIGRNFRNEGIDVTHNPEFTMLEFYEAFSTASKQMDFTENLVRSLVKKVFNTESITNEDSVIDFGKAFERISYVDLLMKYAGINPYTATRDEVKAKAESIGIKVDVSDSREKIIDNVYKKTARPKLISPTFVTDYPVDMLPLAKRSEKNPHAVDVFQLIVAGMEIVKAFSELNDPIDQRARFTKEEENAKAGDAEAQPNDEEFIEALEYGMPPAGGVGIGIDRLTMLLTNTHNIKEVIFFPTMRPKE